MLAYIFYTTILKKIYTKNLRKKEEARTSRLQIYYICR